MIAKAKELDRLLALEGRALGDYVLHFMRVTPGRFVDERNFALHLREGDGLISLRPVVFGKHFAGRTPWLKDWFDVFYVRTVSFKGGPTVDLAGAGLDVRLFRMLADSLEPGGRLFVAYTQREHTETERGLDLGFPPVATPLGSLLWRAGFRWFKNWYFPEGWREGGPKLQANKPLNANVERALAERTAAELSSFLESGTSLEPSELEKAARARSADVLSELHDALQTDKPALASRIKRVLAA